MNNNTKKKDYKKYPPRKDVKSKSSDKDTEMDDYSINSAKLSRRGRDNDPNWYFLDANIADQAASFSFDQYLGIPTKLNVTEIGAGGSTPHVAGVTVPTIMVLECNPSPGDTSSIKTGINMAALSTYTTLSSMNAKTTNYAPQDITMLILGLGEIISMLEHMRRAFGIAFTYNQRNRELPKRLLNAMGFDADDFLENIAQHRLEFNSLVTAVNKIPFLDNIAYLYKCADMYENVYLDSNSNMAQIILMKPYSTWTLNETYDEQGSGLETTTLPVSFSTALNKFDNWMTIITNQITAMLESSTYNYIYSDILNYSAKKGAKLLHLDYLTESYSVVPVYNRNFLMQVHNATFTGKPNITGSNVGLTKFNDVSSNVNKNIINYRPGFMQNADKTFTPASAWIDLDIDNPSVVDKIEATRFTSLLNTFVPASTDTNKILIGDFLPDHYCTTLRVSFPNSYLDVVKEGNGVVGFTNSYQYFDVTAEGSYKTLLYLVGLTQFDWAPIFVIGCEDVNENSNGYSFFGDLNYFTTLDKKWFERVNDLTFQALFNLR